MSISELILCCNMGEVWYIHHHRNNTGIENSEGHTILGKDHCERQGVCTKHSGSTMESVIHFGDWEGHHLQREIIGRVHWLEMWKRGAGHSRQENRMGQSDEDMKQHVIVPKLQGVGVPCGWCISYKVLNMGG